MLAVIADLFWKGELPFRYANYMGVLSSQAACVFQANDPDNIQKLKTRT